MKNAEQYLAELMKAMQDFEHREFTDAQSQDAALTELLKRPHTMLEEMHQENVTTPNYWECDCEDKYLNPVEGNIECEQCHVTADDALDARLHDVLVNMINGEYLSI
jgi:Zn finger protein HypA/HybF involved in hydrogenase expression